MTFNPGFHPPLTSEEIDTPAHSSRIWESDCTDPQLLSRCSGRTHAWILNQWHLMIKTFRTNGQIAFFNQNLHGEPLQKIEYLKINKQTRTLFSHCPSITKIVLPSHPNFCLFLHFNNALRILEMSWLCSVVNLLYDRVNLFWINDDGWDIYKN